MKHETIVSQLRQAIAGHERELVFQNQELTKAYDRVNTLTDSIARRHRQIKEAQAAIAVLEQDATT